MQTSIPPYRPPSPQSLDPLIITTNTHRHHQPTPQTPLSPLSPPPASPSEEGRHRHFPFFHLPFGHHHRHSRDSAAEKDKEKGRRKESPRKEGMQLSREEIAKAREEGREVFKTVRNDWSELVEEEGGIDRLRERPCAEEEGRVEGWVSLESDSDIPIPTSPRSPFKFLSPDDVPNARKRKRQAIEDARVAEEQWNEGLREWNRRREAWVGIKREEPEKQKAGSDDGTGGEKETRKGWPRQARCKSRFADNPLTTQIHPGNYRRIYSSLVVSPSPSTTATVPIPLHHVVGALVQGWKADDQWPPKMSMPEPSVARRKEKKSEGSGTGGSGGGGVYAVVERVRKIFD